MFASVKSWGALLASVAILFLSVPAQAAWDLGGASDEQYVTNFFGTTLLMVTSAPVVDPNTSYWADLLPTELMSNQDYLIGFINAQRVSGGKTLLDAATYPIAIGWETPLQDGRYQYHIDFTGIRPSEVEAIVKLVGGEAKLLPGAQVSVKPLTSGYFSGYSTGSSVVTMTLGSEELSLDAAQPMAAAREKVNALLKRRFGYEVPFTLSLTQDYNYDGAGTVNGSAYLSVNLDVPASGEGGE
jgi:hypothetical protein